MGSWLRLARLRIGISQSEAARRIGVAPSTISGAERQQSELSTEVLTRLAKLYGVPVDFLLRGGNLPWEQRLREGALEPATIAAALRAAREEAGLSQGDIARARGLSPSVISRAEAGQRKASVEVLAAYAACTGKEMGWFTSGYEWTREDDDPKVAWLSSLRSFIRSEVGRRLEPSTEEIVDLVFQALKYEPETTNVGWAGLLHQVRVSRGELRASKLLGAKM